jgi:hypothetical protein
MVSGIHGRVTFQTSSSSVPELRTTLEIGQKRCRSAFTFSRSERHYDVNFTPREDKTIDFSDQDQTYKTVLYRCPD